MMVSLPPNARRRARSRTNKLADEEEGMIPEGEAHEGSAPWQLGDASDDEDGADVPKGFQTQAVRRGQSGWVEGGEGERARMITDQDDAEGEEEHRESTSSDATLARPENEATVFVDDEFGEWGEGKQRS